jgi:tetratricopeptide (TPR) repeat protein
MISRGYYWFAIAFICLMTILPKTSNASYFSGVDQVISPQKTSLYHVESRMHLDKNRPDSALISLTRALHEDPENIKIVIKIADLYYRKQSYDQAIDLLRNYVHRATAEHNVYYYLALCYDKKSNLQFALGYYYKALTANPYLLKAYVRIARVRTKQGLPYDALKALKKCLSINPDYFPALQEERVANRLVKQENNNIYRKENVVITFSASKLYSTIKEIYPRIKENIQYLESNLRYHIPEIWIKVVNKVERFDNPPALYDHLDGCIYISEEAVSKGNLGPLAHEICRMYTRKVCGASCPDWLEEGMAMWITRPDIIKNIAVRSLGDQELDFQKKFPREKNYLRWESVDETMKKRLLVAYLIVKYILKNYGWPSMRKILAAYKDDTKSWKKICWDVLHIDEKTFQRKWDIYVMSNHYFQPVSIH